MAAYDLLGYLAGLCLLAMAASRSQSRMRAFNMAANCLFIAYALIGGLLPVLFLNAVLLALHLSRYVQAMRQGSLTGDR
jgi:hypothetical protein